MSRDSSERWRCLEVGCNPKLKKHNAQQHKGDTGHRVAKWPVRSAAGKAKQRERNRLNPSPYSYRFRSEPTNRDDEAMSEYYDSKSDF
jgi:hypothetical protein